MNNIGINYSALKKVATLLFLLSTICYLAAVNYRLPFMTMDEIRAIAFPLSDMFDLVGSYGRPSQVIGLLVNQVISFRDVEFLSLTPRFMTMIALLFSLVVFFQKLGIPKIGSIWVVCFAVLTHEIDWQHNGLVAFFGGYNLLLAMFLMGVLIVENQKKNPIRWTAAYLLILLSFASEFFVGLMAVYLVACWIEKFDAKKIALSPHLWALLTYSICFVVLKVSYQEEVHSSRMVNYLVGSVSGYDTRQIGQGALVYFVNSVPLYGRGPIFSSWIAGGAVALTMVTAILVGLRTNGAWRGGCSEAVSMHGEKRRTISFSLYSVLVCLVFAPPILLSLQPMKLDWVLAGASTRYAFSLYSWVGLVGLLSMMALLYPVKLWSVKLSAIAAAAIYVAISLVNNFDFLSKYKTSFSNWKELHERLVNDGGHVVDLPISLFKHPYIMSPLTPDRGLMNKFVEFQYQKSIRICRDGFDFSGPLVMPINVNKLTGALLWVSGGRGDVVRIDGFHSPEDWGRWTAGSLSQIYLSENLSEKDVVELEVGGGFSENSILPTRFKIGENVKMVIIDKPRTVRISVEKDVEAPVVVITTPKPQSPLGLGYGADSRVLGIMVKSLRILRPDQEGRLKNISQGCF